MFSHRLDDRTELRLLEERHAPMLFALVDKSRAPLRTWLPWVDSNSSADDSRAFIAAALQQYAANLGFHAGIWHDRQLAGVIGLHHLCWNNRSTRLGYWLGEEFQGKGLVTMACRAVIDFVFFELDLNKVEIDPAPENRKSRNVPERLGFVQEGVLRDAEWLYDHFVDHVVYGMRKDEWLKNRAVYR